MRFFWAQRECLRSKANADTTLYVAQKQSQHTLMMRGDAVQSCKLRSEISNEPQQSVCFLFFLCWSQTPWLFLKLDRLLVGCAAGELPHTKLEVWKWYRDNRQKNFFSGSVERLENCFPAFIKWQNGSTDPQVFWTECMLSQLILLMRILLVGYRKHAGSKLQVQRKITAFWGPFWTFFNVMGCCCCPWTICQAV